MDIGLVLISIGTYVLCGYATADGPDWVVAIVLPCFIIGGSLVLIQLLITIQDITEFNVNSKEAWQKVFFITRFHKWLDSKKHCSWKGE